MPPNKPQTPPSTPQPAPSKSYEYNPTPCYENGLKDYKKSNPGDCAILAEKLDSLFRQLCDGTIFPDILKGGNPKLRNEKNKMFALDSRGTTEEGNANAELRLLLTIAHPDKKNPKGTIHLLAVTDKTDQQDAIDYWKPKLKHLKPPP